MIERKMKKTMVSKKNIKDFMLYVIVGGIATVCEWIIFYILNTTFAWHYILATVIAYILSTFVNWAAGRIIMFKKTEKGLLHEITSIYAASVIGLLLNMLIMWLMVDLFSINSMLSKVIATGLVFIWNFLIRKIVIYK